MSVWAPAGTPEQVQWITDAIAQTTFPWELLGPGLQARTGKTSIPVVFSDLSARGYVYGGYVYILTSDHVDATARRAVWGLAWSDGRIEIERTLNREQAQTTWVCEAMHELDWFFMSGAQREAIWRAYHASAGPVAAHAGHGWFEEAGSRSYGSWVGESLMIGGVRAFSSFTVADQFEHQSTPQVVAAIREALLPDPVLRIRGYGRYHRERCRFIRRAISIGRSTANGGLVFYRHWLAAEQSRLTPCRVCRPARGFRG